MVREDTDGDLDFDLTNLTALNNDGDGIAFDGNAAGHLTGAVLKAKTVGNTDAGIHAEQATTGAGALKVRWLTASGNGDGNVEADAGVTVDLR